VSVEPSRNSNCEIYISILFVYREVSVPVQTANDACSLKIKADQSETKTVKHILNYIPFQAAFEADAAVQLNKRSWQRIKSHFIMMKSTNLEKVNSKSLGAFITLPDICHRFAGVPDSNETRSRSCKP